MSQFQNLQKLRKTNKVVLLKDIAEYESQKEKQDNHFKLKNFGSVRLNVSSSRQAYDRFLDSKAALPKKTSLKRACGSSLSVLNRRQMSPFSGLSIYNLSSNQSRKDSISNALTERRQYASIQLEDLESSKPAIETLSKVKFTRQYIIGKGGFSKVWKVQLKKTGVTYAMKEMYKTKIINKKSIHSVMNERKLLSELNYPFLVNMSYAFQDKEHLYLVMDYLNGGDLRFHMIIRRFSETESKFFIACLLLSLTYLHNHGIIHRDVKPENLVLQSNGYVRLTDLGISNKWRQNNCNDTSGTPGYMAPEVLRHKNHSFGVDYFAVGILIYELMMDRRPYLGNRKEIREQVMVRQAMIKPEQIPKGWSAQAADFANKLMIRNPEARLGAKGDQQVRKHPWLKSVDWTKLFRKQIPAPYVPQTIQQNYEEYKQQISEDSELQSPEQNALILRSNETQKLFQGYIYPQIAQNTKITKSTFQTNSSITQIPEDLLNRIFKDPRRHG